MLIIDSCWFARQSWLSVEWAQRLILASIADDDIDSRSRQINICVCSSRVSVQDAGILIQYDDDARGKFGNVIYFYFAIHPLSFVSNPTNPIYCSSSICCVTLNGLYVKVVDLVDTPLRGSVVYCVITVILILCTDG